MIIRSAKKKEIDKHIQEAKKSNLVFNKSTEYFVIVDKNGKIIGMSGLMLFKNKAIFKNDFVLKQYRGNGYFKKMVNFRINYCKNRGIKKLEATCTPMSYRYYRAVGFEPVTYYKNGCIKVIYEDILKRERLRKSD